MESLWILTVIILGLANGKKKYNRPHV